LFSETIGQVFVGYQPSVANALLKNGYLRRVVKPDRTSGVVCTQWELDIKPLNQTAAEAEALNDSDGIVEIQVMGRCRQSARASLG
jgi:hypothetical protein